MKKSLTKQGKIRALLLVGVLSFGATLFPGFRDMAAAIIYSLVVQPDDTYSGGWYSEQINQNIG